MNDFENDLEMAFYSALAMLGVSPRLDCRYESFKSLKATASLKDGTITVRASVGFMAAPQDVLQGMALYLLGRIYRKNPAGADYYLRQYREFMTRQSTARLNSAIRRQKPLALDTVGAHVDLRALLEKVVAEQAAVLGTTRVDGIGWSAKLGSRVLAYHDESFNAILVNDSFDNPAVPPFVVEYLIFHELLHSKHGARYQRGESLRRMVHTGAFRADERTFPCYADAESWLGRNWRRLSRR